jgi:hypothetical protein
MQTAPARGLRLSLFAICLLRLSDIFCRLPRPACSA